MTVNEYECSTSGRRTAGRFICERLHGFVLWRSHFASPCCDFDWHLDLSPVVIDRPVDLSLVNLSLVGPSLASPLVSPWAVDTYANNLGKVGLDWAAGLDGIF
jgi:hypothetical protein